MVQGADLITQLWQFLKAINFQIGTKISPLFPGKSWCPDCVTGQPVVEATLEKEVTEPANYLYVGVGGRDFWKDPNCIFRTNALTKLKSVPTLFKWGAAENRLEEEKCAKPDFVTMLIED